MADSYDIVARIVAEDASDSAVNSAQRKLQGVADKASAVGRTIAALAGVTGIGGAVFGIVKLNASIDEAERGMAALFNAVTGTNIVDSLGAARGMIKGLQADAAAGAGGLQDYVKAFQGIYGVAGSVSPLENIRTLSKNVLNAAFALRGERGLWEGPMDIQQALTAGAHDRTTPVVMAALRASQISSEAFNRMGLKEKVDVLNKAFEKFAPGIALMGKSWSAQTATLKDNLAQIIRSLTGRVFDSWLAALTRANEFIAKHKYDIMYIVDKWGRNMLAFWDAMISKAGIYAGILATSAVAIPVARGAGALAAGGLGTGALGGAFASFAALGGILKIAAGLGIGPFLAAVGGAISSLGVSLGALVWPLGVAAAAFAVVATGVTAMWSAAVGASPGFLSFRDGLYRLGVAFDGLVTQLQPVIDAFTRFSYALGDKAWSVLGFIVDLLTGVLVVFKDIAAFATGGFSGLWKEIQDQSVWLDPEKSGAEQAMTPRGGKRYKVHALATPGPLNLNIGTAKFEIKAEVNADPDRMMSALTESVNRVRLYAIQGRRLPVPT